MLNDMPSRKPSSSLQVVLDPAIVMACVGLDETGILAGVKAGTFPKPIKFDDRVVWKEPDIQAWITARTAAGDKVVIAPHQSSPAMDRLIHALAVEYAKGARVAKRVAERDDH